MRVARVEAQAKINQVLKVLDRDSTGFHEIVTLFQRIDLADEITVRTDVAGRALDVSGPHLPAGGLGPVEKNLAYRAALEFADRAEWPDGFAIEITKKIPVGGGLGGGSADAGGVLRTLNALAPRPLSEAAMFSAAAALGSDVPFLAKNWARALGMGRGTDLKNMSDGAETYHVVIVVPGFSIGTADAYRWLDEDRSKPGYRMPPPPPLKPIGPNESEEEEEVGNDFEPVVEARFPELRRIRERLVEKGAFKARLAGSGSCVFGVFRQIPPQDSELGLNAHMIRTRLSARVVQVQVLE